MLIRVQDKVFSIEGIERVIYFKHNKEGKIFCKINYKLKNAVRIPEWKQYDEPELEILELEKSKKGAFDLRHVQTEAIFWNWILKGDFYFDGEKLQITPASWVSFLVKEVQYARRYTKESQFKELKRYFDMIWGDLSCSKSYKTSEGVWSLPLTGTTLILLGWVAQPLLSIPTRDS